LTPRGEWVTPILFGVVDDRSRLACHLQWYLAENAENIVHGLSQAMQKRGMPRSAMSDNGAAMTAAEVNEGLARLGVLHQTTLPYSPYVNGKQEVLWAQVERRLMAMLEGVEDLTLARLNEATQAWAEYEYNRKPHSEIGEAPLTRFLTGPEVTRPCPDGETLALAFTRTERRTLRKSDGTISLPLDASRAIPLLPGFRDFAGLRLGRRFGVSRIPIDHRGRGAQWSARSPRGFSLEGESLTLAKEFVLDVARRFDDLPSLEVFQSFEDVAAPASALVMRGVIVPAPGWVAVFVTGKRTMDVGFPGDRPRHAEMTEQLKLPAANQLLGGRAR
jgi:hypothetical protein